MKIYKNPSMKTVICSISGKPKCSWEAITAGKLIKALPEISFEVKKAVTTSSFYITAALKNNTPINIRISGHHPAGSSSCRGMRNDLKGSVKHLYITTPKNLTKTIELINSLNQGGF